jgi:hypothetical protein
MAYLRLHIQQADGHLPMVCMRCGEPATVIKVKKLSVFPRWIFWLIVVHLFLFVIVALIMTRRARLQAPLCDSHQGHWTIRQALQLVSLIGLVIFGICLVIFFMTVQPQQAGDLIAVAFIGGFVLLTAWLILVAIVQSSAIRAVEITKTHMLLAGVSDGFVLAVEEAEIERRVRLRQWDNEDTEPAPRIRHSPEEIQEDFPRLPGPPPDAFQK